MGKRDPLDTKDLGSGQDLNPLLRRDTVSDSGGVFVVVHEQQVEVVDVSDDELFVAGWEEVLGLLVGTVTDLGHGELTLESSSDLFISAGTSTA